MISDNCIVVATVVEVVNTYAPYGVEWLYGWLLGTLAALVVAVVTLIPGREPPSADHEQI